jgi:membrane associated rhomboid family serine protease
MAASNLEILLQLIAQAAPGSWHPRLYAERSDVPLAAINYFLEHLYLDGLITRGVGDEQTGPGVTLTAKGQQVLQDPEAMDRLRQGKAIDPGDRGGIVREFLRRPFRPVVTWTLIGLNVAVFAYGLFLASQVNLTGAFLGGILTSDLAPGVAAIQEFTGAVSAFDIITDRWWRLLTACFVHGGLIHLVMNMWVLRSLGSYAEQMWGRWRYLILYLLAGWGSSCLGMALAPGSVQDGKWRFIQMVGASGAICGLLGAEPVWVLLNRKYLPRSFLNRWRTGFFSNLVLIVFISVFPGVSGLGHLGGAVTGALVALLLHWQRFGPKLWRWLGLLALLPLPWLGYVGVQYARQTNPTWKQLELFLSQRLPDDRR